MEPRKERTTSYQIANRYSMLVSLFLICSLHLMVFGFFEIPDNFLNVAFQHVLVYLKILRYSVILLTSCFHYILLRYFSLKITLMAGLLCNIIGLSLTWLSLLLGGSLALIVLSFIFISFALISVLNCLITYIVIDLPENTGVGIMTMFAFGNGGLMMSNIIFSVFEARQFSSNFFLLTIVLLVLSIIFIGAKFYNPPFPKHLEHLRKGGLIWRELHYRLVFFILSIIAYGFVESIFGVWGEDFLLQYLPQNLAKDTVSIFWFSMIIGQIILLLPLYLYPARRIFSILILFLIGTIIFLERQTYFPGLMASFILAGFGCAAMFPILLSFLEKELMEISTLSHQNSYLPHIETGTCLMLGGYFLGIGIVDLWLSKYTAHPEIGKHQIFHLGIILLAAIGLMTAYLNWSSVNPDE